MSGRPELATIEVEKTRVREEVWKRFPRTEHGKIPYFATASLAAQRLTQLSVWRDAKYIMVTPDPPQEPVVRRALIDEKVVYMAVPGLRRSEPFFHLVPSLVELSAADRRVAAKTAPTISLEDMEPVQLVVGGSVAVDRRGVRIGKGKGYFDLEQAMLIGAGLLRSESPTITLVDDCQVFTDPLQTETPHDVRMDMVVTPSAIYFGEPLPRPSGIYAEYLTPDKIAEIPALQAIMPASLPPLNDGLR